MKSVSTALFLFLAILSCQSSAQKKPQILSVLWKIQSPKTHKTSYLLGTYHFFSEEWLTAHPKIDSLLTLSNIYIAEVIAADQDAHQQNNRPTSVHVKAKELFGKDYDKVNQYFVKNTGEGLTENIDNDEDPALILTGMVHFLIQDLAAKKGFKISHDEIDGDLLKRAVAQNKPTIQLDNDKVLRSVATGDGITEGKIKLIVNLVDIANNPAQADKIPNLDALKLYEKGKYKFNFTSVDMSGEKVAKAITRNNLWMKKLPTYLNKDKAFIVVGAGHLDGKNGLIMQLKGSGYKVSPIEL